MAQGKNLDADVIICGCGFSGLAAGLTASDGGASVIIFEKRPIPGGTSIFVEGMFGAETSMQIARNVGITKEEAFKTHMNYSHWRANGRLVREFIDRSANTIEWLQQMGVKFDRLVAIRPGNPQVWHLFKKEHPRKRGGAAVIDILVAKAKERGIQIHLDTPVKELMIDKKNRVTGVIAKDKNGNTINTNAKAVIISSGDFSNNREMLKENTKWGNTVVRLPDMKMTGDGIKMAWAVGAAAEGVSVVLGRATLTGSKASDDLYAMSRRPYLWINQRGERFCPEDIGFSAKNALESQLNGMMYLIFDEDTKRYTMEKGISWDVGRNFQVNTKLTELEAGIESGIKEGNAFVADTLKELSEKIGVDINVFQSTLDEYNRCCEGHYDNIFFKNPKYLQPVKKAKFYAIKICLEITATFGGIKINHKAEVMNKNHQVISGLYAVGNCAGGLYGDSYDIEHTTGGAASFALTSGRIAGENALKYIGKTKF